MQEDAHNLTRRAIAGDAEARAAVWREHRAWVAAVLLAHGPGGAGADGVEDMLQDVAVAFVRSIGGLEDPARLRGWLRTVAVNAARSAGRGVTRRRKLGPVLLGDRDDDLAEREPAFTGSSAEQVEAVLARVAALPDELREPLMLKAVEGMSQRQIADALDLTVPAVESRLARARRLLRSEPVADGLFALSPRQQGKRDAH